VVHNGIIENHLALRQALMDGGAQFTSETDTEIFAHLIAAEIAKGEQDLTAAVREALTRVEGGFAIVVMSDAVPLKPRCAPARERSWPWQRGAMAISAISPTTSCSSRRRRSSYNRS
jgi:hypothetical protein